MPEGFHQSRVPENKRFIILSSGLVALTIIFYLFFILLSSITQNSIDKINASISESDQIINEAKMISEDLSIDQLGEFKKRLDNHTYWSQIFPEIEARTLPNIYFSQLSTSLDEAGVATLDLAGKANNYNDLARQVIAYRESEKFLSVDFSTSGADKDGGVNINFRLSLPQNELQH